MPAETCAECGEKITKKGIAAIDKYWHEDCFKCGTCSKPMNGMQYIVQDGKPNHIECLQRVCARCNEIIPPTEGMVHAIDRYYHPQCFICKHCDKVIEDDIFDYIGTIAYHQTCKDIVLKLRAEKGEEVATVSAVMAAPQPPPEPEYAGDKDCFVCGKNIPVTTGLVQAMEKDFHPDCFKCHQCGDAITEETFTYVDTTIFHPPCFEKFKEEQEEKRRKAEEEARRKAEEEARRKREEEEAKRKAEEEAEAARKAAEEEARRKAEAEAEAKRKAEEEEARRKAEEEEKKRAAEEAERKAKEEEEARRKAAEEAKRRAEEEAEAARLKALADEEAQRQAELEAARKAREDERRRADEEDRRRKEEASKRRRKGPTCVGCKKEIQVLSEGTSVDGRPWHKACFKCSKCGEMLDGDFIEVEGEDGKVFHEKCLEQVENNKECPGCGREINQYDKVSIIDARSWHPDCFRCKFCDEVIKTSHYVEAHDRSVYHESCMETLKANKRDIAHEVKEISAKIKTNTTTETLTKTGSDGTEETVTAVKIKTTIDNVDVSDLLKEKTLRELFDSLDEDKNGCITQEEMRLVYQHFDTFGLDDSQKNN
eukprot:TRINITY_DN29847_c0_g1_i2.p1 TRINITY_DN29847_c0_g1~~TRINITY_DN29847_c0_g1_i2.p1  ORF type:complete len:597 (+),score=112.40 TRINITY_DN29847_c0_g1_i2:62-1852(+)